VDEKGARRVVIIKMVVGTSNQTSKTQMIQSQFD
jgi:hypothetical protein